MENTKPAENTKQTTVVFCLPGNSYSRNFLLCWSKLMFECIKRNVTPIISQQYSSFVSFSRTMCLNGNVLNGKNQKPFQGQLDYDYIMWIDSDQVFNPEQFFQVLDSPHQVTCGMYIMSNGKEFPIVKKWDIEYFKNNGKFEFLTPDYIKGYTQANPNNKYLPVAYCGMGFMCIKKGVVEQIEYPWFSSEVNIIADNIIDISSEDVSFCRKLITAGIEVVVDTSVIVGHEKMVIL